MQKRSVINRVYNATKTATSHIYKDDDWSGVKNLYSLIEGALPLGWALQIGESRYKGVMGECGHRKVYSAIITDSERQSIQVRIVASFCGTIEDPMGLYDLTLLMN